jgi:hypothetical protein
MRPWHSARMGEEVATRGPVLCEFLGKNPQNPPGQSAFHLATRPRLVSTPFRQLADQNAKKMRFSREIRPLPPYLVFGGGGLACIICYTGHVFWPSANSLPWRKGSAPCGHFANSGSHMSGESTPAATFPWSGEKWPGGHSAQSQVTSTKEHPSEDPPGHPHFKVARRPVLRRSTPVNPSQPRSPGQPRTVASAWRCGGEVAG